VIAVLHVGLRRRPVRTARVATRIFVSAFLAPAVPLGSVSTMARGWTGHHHATLGRPHSIGLCCRAHLFKFV